MFQRWILALLVLLVPAAAMAQLDSIIITDAGFSGDHVVWSPAAADFYLITERIFVETGDTLEILPGTVIKAEPGTADSAAALIVSRGGYLIADGTADNPIIFTCQADDVTDPFDLPENLRGQWGGLVLLGVAGTNRAGDSGNIEGVPISESRAIYGPGAAFPLNNADNSGIVRYVSLRYGGSIIGANNELNGLTLGAVGSGTTIDYVEAYNNADDGIEWFGGTVDVKHFVTARCDDDGFDYDEGWRGRVQYGLLFNDDADGGSGGEHDGGTTPEDGVPYATPVFANMTYIGSGDAGDALNDMGINIRDNAGGSYYNSIFYDFKGFGMQIEDLVSGKDSRERLDSGQIEFRGTMWYSFGSGDSAAGLFPQTWTRTHMTNPALDNDFGVDPSFAGPPALTRPADGSFDPRPTLGSPAAFGAYNLADPFFDDVTYKGAFEPGGSNWANGWTALSSQGYMMAEPLDSIIITDAGFSGDHVVWSPDSAKFYLITERIFVETGDTLEILPGTVIKAEPGAADSAAALIVSRGGYLIADGTATNPIIFTCQADNPADPFDLPENLRGQWGGLVLLGVAGTNRAGDSGNIEGVPITESRAIYGPGAAFPLNNADNSGIVRYVSLRYGGSIIGANNELNGLTLGAVGSGTTIDYVEAYNNADDGIEWFGGTVDVKHFVTARCDDDGFDYDEGWRGRVQYGLLFNDDADGGSGGEHDGGTTPEDGVPYATPVFANMTYIGCGDAGDALNDMGINIRDNAGGSYYSSIFADFKGFGAQIEDLVSGKDSRERLDSGQIVFQRNIWYSFGSGDSAAGLFPQAWTRAHMTAPANQNQLGVNPKFMSWPKTNRPADGSFNPVPRMGGPAASGGVVPVDPFFDVVTYKGAFAPEADPAGVGAASTNWALGWTALDQHGYFGNGNFCAILVDGDLNASNTVTSSDIIALVNYVFKGGSAPEPCAANGDVNCSGSVSSADVITLVNFVFKAGPAPCDICNTPAAQDCIP